MRRWLLGALLVAAALVVPTAYAGAQQYPICSLNPSITAERVSDGVSVDGTGFAVPFQDVEVTVDGEHATPATGPSFSVVVPGEAPHGATVRAVAVAAGGEATCQARAQLDSTPPPPPPPPEAPPDLPPTGNDITIAWIGLAAVVLGVALVVAVRRRRSMGRITHRHSNRHHTMTGPNGRAVRPTATDFVQYTPEPRQTMPAALEVPELPHPTPEPTPAPPATPPAAPPAAPDEGAFERSIRVMRATFASWAEEGAPVTKR